MTRRRELTGNLLVAASAIGFAITSILAKFLYADGMNFQTLLAIRFMMGAALTWGMAIVAGTARDFSREGLAFVLLGMYLSLNSLTMFASLSLTTASATVLLFYSYPAMVAVVSIFLGQRMTRVRLTALVMATVGVALTAGFDLAAGVTPLMILPLLAAALYTVYAIASENMLGRTTLKDPGRYVITGACLSLTAAMLLSRDIAPPQSWHGWAILAIVALISTVGAIRFFLMGVDRVGAAQASLISTLEPLATALLAALVLGELMTPLQYLGGLLIVVAVVILRLLPSGAMGGAG